MQDNELFKKKRRPFSPETVDSRRKRAPLLITWHYSTGQGQCQMKISAKGREVLLRQNHPPRPKNRGGGRVYAEAGGQFGVCRVNKLTIDNEQLTIMVSLRDELKLFLNYFRRKFLNCQLSTVNCQFDNPQHSHTPQFPGQSKMPFLFRRTFDESKGALPNKSRAPLKMPFFTQPRCWVRRGCRSSRGCGCIFRSGLCTGIAPDRPDCR